MTNHASSDPSQYETCKVEELVPVSLSMTIEGLDIHDAFLWNLHGTYPTPLPPFVPFSSSFYIETHMTPLQFAKLFADDLSLPDKCIVPIAHSIATQIERHRAALRPQGENEDEDDEFMMMSNPSKIHENSSWYVPPPTPLPAPKIPILCVIQVSTCINYES